MACAFRIWERFQVFAMGEIEYFPDVTVFPHHNASRNIELCKGGTADYQFLETPVLFLCLLQAVYGRSGPEGGPFACRSTRRSCYACIRFCSPVRTEKSDSGVLVMKRNYGIETRARCGGHHRPAPNLRPAFGSAERPHALVAGCRRGKVYMLSRRENRSCAYPRIDRPHQTKNLNQNRNLV
jgi:hypothetical protein